MKKMIFLLSKIKLYLGISVAQSTNLRSTHKGNSIQRPSNWAYNPIVRIKMTASFQVRTGWSLFVWSSLGIDAILPKHCFWCLSFPTDPCSGVATAYHQILGAQISARATWILSFPQSSVRGPIWVVVLSAWFWPSSGLSSDLDAIRMGLPHLLECF